MIHLARDGAQLGQFTLQQVNDMLAAGQLKPTDLGWQEGLPAWLPISSMEGVTSLSSSAPAPGLLPVQPTAAPSVYSPPRSVVSSSFHQAGQVPPGSIQALKETRPWVLFLASLGIIGTGLMLLAALGMLLAGGAVSRSAGMPAGMSAGLMAGLALGYLILALIYIYPIVKLFKYSGAIKRLSYSGSAADLDEALRQQKSFWKFMGIAALVLMVLYFVAIIVVIAGGFSAAGMGRSTPSAFPPAPATSP